MNKLLLAILALGVMAVFSATGVQAQVSHLASQIIPGDFGDAGDRWTFLGDVVIGNGLAVTSGDLQILSGNLDVIGNILVTGTINSIDISTLDDSVTNEAQGLTVASGTLTLSQAGGTGGGSVTCVDITGHVDLCDGTDDVGITDCTAVTNCVGSIGDVVGPASSTDNRIALFNGITGKLLKQSTSFSTSGNRLSVAANAVLPNIVLDSTSTGSGTDDWDLQGAYISIGESGALGAAAMHMTYRGDGYGYIGSGAVPTTGGSRGIPGASSGSYLRFDYNSDNIYTPDIINAGGYTEAGSATLTNSITGNAGTVDSHSITASTNNRIVRHSGANLLDSGIQDNSNAVAITIDASENVAIGSTSVSAGLKLDVTGNVGATQYCNADGGSCFSASDVGSGGSSLWTPSGSNIFYNTGNVGIGTTTIPEKLTVNGNVQATAFLYSSDYSLKKNITTLDNSLEKILKLRGVSFNWKEDGQPSIGLVAQEVEKVFPELVTGENGSKTVQYGNLVAVLIEAVKEQQKEIVQLEARIKILENVK